jgi:hypothetical protein
MLGKHSTIEYTPRPGIAFLISFSDTSPLAHNNNTDFYKLTLCLATLLDSFISSDIFLVESLDFSLYKIMSSTSGDNLASSFLIWRLFISFTYLVALTRTFSIMLDKSEHPCLVPDLRMKAFCFSLFSMTLVCTGYICSLLG